MCEAWLPKHTVGIVGLSILLMGCSGGFGGSDSDPAVYPVHGKVLVDGAPKPYVRVGLIPLGSTDNQPVATGMTDAQGEFTLTTGVETVTADKRPTSKILAGAEPGEYYVSMSWLKPIRPNSSEPEFGDELLPAKYQDPVKSGLPELRVTIQEMDNELTPFQLKRR